MPRGASWSARAYSSAAADGCSARYRISIFRDVLRDERRVKGRTGRFNACRYETDSPGVTYGIVAALFDVGDLPPARYIVRVTASQDINGGRPYIHVVCRRRTI